jgi:hypothetical protein
VPPLELGVTAAQQLIVGLLFFAIGTSAYRFGDEAQRAAEKNIAAQGIVIDNQTLRRSGLQLAESRTTLLFPLGIGTILVVAAWLVWSQSPAALAIAWTVEILLLVVVGVVTAAQVFPARFLAHAWARAEDERLRRIDVHAVMQQAEDAFPPWVRPLIVARFVLATVGSLVVIVLLMLAQV